jgi:hypothetical protein
VRDHSRSHVFFPVLCHYAVPRFPQNLTDKMDGQFNEEMIESGLLKTLENLKVGADTNADTNTVDGLSC